MGMPTDGKIVLVLDLGTPNAFAQAACINDIQVSNVRRVNYDWVKAPHILNVAAATKNVSI